MHANLRLFPDTFARHPSTYTTSLLLNPSACMQADLLHDSRVLAVDAKNAVKGAASNAAAGAERMAGLDPKQGASMLTCLLLVFPTRSCLLVDTCNSSLLLIILFYEC